MRVITVTLLFLVMVFGIIAFTGWSCSSSKPTEPEVTPGPEPIAPESPAALSEEEAWEKAKKIVREMWWEEQQLTYRFIATNDLSTFNEDKERIRFRASGLTSDQIAVLQTIHMGENLGDRRRIHDLIGVYLKLSFQYPEKTEPELLELFREAARNKETQIKLIEWSEKEAWEKARALIQERWRKQKKMLDKLFKEEEKIKNKAEREDFESRFWEDYDRLTLEMTGLTSDNITFLVQIHFEENPEEKKVVDEIQTDGVICEYLKLLFQYPEKTKVELFDFFREAAKNGETHVRIEVVRRIYGVDRSE